MMLKLGTISESISEIHWKFLNMVLQKDEEDQLDWSCKNEEVLQKVKGERNRLQTIKRKNTTLIGKILRRNCLLKHVIGGKIEGRIEVTGTRGRRRKQLLDEFKKNWWYWNVKEETLDFRSCRTCCERCHVPFAGQTAKLATRSPDAALQVEYKMWMKIMKQCLASNEEYTSFFAAPKAVALNQLRIWYNANNNGHYSKGCVKFPKV
jgi:hypothetical protein